MDRIEPLQEIQPLKSRNSANNTSHDISQNVTINPGNEISHSTGGIRKDSHQLDKQIKQFVHGSGSGHRHKHVIHDLPDFPECRSHFVCDTCVCHFLHHLADDFQQCPEFGCHSGEDTSQERHVDGSDHVAKGSGDLANQIGQICQLLSDLRKRSTQETLESLGKAITELLSACHDWLKGSGTHGCDLGNHLRCSSLSAFEPCVDEAFQTVDHASNAGSGSRKAFVNGRQQVSHPFLACIGKVFQGCSDTFDGLPGRLRHLGSRTGHLDKCIVELVQGDVSLLHLIVQFLSAAGSDAQFFCDFCQRILSRCLHGHP